MINFHFRVSVNEKIISLYILADCFENALDILFERNQFDNYEFVGIVDS